MKNEKIVVIGAMQNKSIKCLLLFNFSSINIELN